MGVPTDLVICIFHIKRATCKLYRHTNHIQSLKWPTYDVGKVDANTGKVITLVS